MAYGRSTDGAWYQKSIPIFNQFSTVAYKQRSPDYSNSPAQSTVCCLPYGLRANHVLSVYQEGTRDVYGMVKLRRYDRVVLQLFRKPRGRAAYAPNEWYGFFTTQAMLK